MRVSRLFLAAILAVVSPSSKGEARNDELLGLVPVDSAIVLSIDGFREHSREVFESDLVRKLANLPSVRSWLESDQGKAYFRSKAEIETALGLRLGDVRDEIVGDSVVLALQMRPDGEANGLFLTRARDCAILLKLVAAINKSEKADGTLVEVAELPHEVGEPSVFRRQFKANIKPVEWYTVFPDGRFAWSNSESLIRGVVSRRTGENGLRNSPRYRKVRDALPVKALVRLYVDPAIMLKVATDAKSLSNPQVVEALKGLDYLGAAVEWRDGPVVHLHQTFDLEKIPPALRPRSSGEEISADVLSRVPRTAIAVAAWRWDLPSSFDALLALIPESERPRVEATQTALQGILMGKDLRREILPALKPGGIAFVDLREPLALPSFAAAIDVTDRPDVSEALENAVRTLAALISLDKTRKDGPIRVEVATHEGLRVSRLIGASQCIAFAATAKQFLIGPDEATLRRLFSDAPSALPLDGTLSRLQASYFPRSDGFVAADLAAVYRYALANREALVRREVEKRGGKSADADRDFQRALDLLEPFGGAFLTWDIAGDGRSAHQSLGLIGRSGSKAR